VVELDVDGLEATALGITLNRTAELAEWDSATLGRLLGEVIAAAEGEDFLELVERIRTLSKAAREEDRDAREQLLALLRGLREEQLVPVARAFSQFLNLANIADQQHTVSREMDSVLSASQTLNSVIAGLRGDGVSAASIMDAVGHLRIELVLTAHPTEITRRTLIHKHGEIGRCLSELELQGHTERERAQIILRLRELIAQIWYGHDFRQDKPTPVDEARWGFAVVEDSLWQALPEFLRRLDGSLMQHCDSGLSLQSTPVSFLSWMGGDRDGNPNVTASVTASVLLQARWKAAELYLADIRTLIDELSMTHANPALRELGGDAHEPYRAVLRDLRALLTRTLAALEDQLSGRPVGETDILHSADQLFHPLASCYQSLQDCGMGIIADGALLDLIRRVQCFGVHLLKLDVRQDSARHTAALAEITDWLGLGNFEDWDEPARQVFLLQELNSRRPLLPAHWRGSDETMETLDTCRVIAQHPAEAFGAYVISMASRPSDMLAVLLLLQECGCHQAIPVSPLFETLEDLENAAAVVDALLSEDWYREYAGATQMVMIGYSDSAKDAGVLAASWAQYRAQEKLLEVCGRHGVELMLFHGRGGTIGRGGAPARAALLSQPPGSLRNGLRVTEQGETIRAKLGTTSMATKTLALYTSAILETNLVTPPAPDRHWRELMDRLAAESCDHYRAMVRGEELFVDYFRQATPERELATLPLGSRPARRRADGGIESLRAIPWIFAWSQNRLMLPAWLGAGSALTAATERGERDQLLELALRWPFFATRLSMLEMVFAKADSGIAAYYDEQLVEPGLRDLGKLLRSQMTVDQQVVLELLGKDTALEDQDWLRESIQLRNVYTDPLNFLQAELLKRQREEENATVGQAIMVTIAGVAAGMRNTG
jgi:phosphoenolpyruvate carboxylase